MSVWFYNQGRDTSANIVVLADLDGEGENKFLQFVVVFWLLKQGWPLTDFEAMKLLF
jgi:hypothetical protein